MRFLWEIGCEELPPHFIPSAMRELKDNTEELLRESLLPFSQIVTYGTPRRLVLLIEGLPASQQAREIEVKGPPYNVAFDERGQPTPAAFGFAKAQNVSVEQLIVKEDKQGKYVYALKREEGQPTERLLAQILPSLFSSLSLPKSMRWDNSSLRFVRPVRWMLALLDDKVVEANIGGLKTGRVSYIKRFQDEEVEIRDVEHYLQVMRERGIILQPEERERLIMEKAKELAGSVGGKLHYTPQLVEEVVFLNERPTPFLGRIEEQFLTLPKEIVAIVMQKNLYLFPILSGDGSLLPYFVGVRDDGEAGLEKVVKGYEGVLKARLADAFFFFQEDLKSPLEEKTKLLEGIVFLQGLGSIGNKVRRLLAVVSNLAPKLNLDEEKVVRAGQLCRADLTTNMVREFPDLQGIVGREYAKIQGEPLEVAEAIYESYLYTSSVPHAPETPIGRLLSLLDKLDTLVGAFHLGLQPSGSSDPFALRRAGQTVVDLLAEEDALDLSELLKLMEDAYLKELGIKVRGKEELMEFLEGRIAITLRDKGIRYDIVNALLSTKVQNVAELFRKAFALQELKDHPDFVPMVMAAVRLINILRFAERKGESIPPADEASIRRELLQVEEEIALYEEARKSREKLQELSEKRDYIAMFLALAPLKERINNFFDKVFVMTDDLDLRQNRLALVNFVWQLFFTFGDLSQIVIEGKETQDAP